MSAIQGSGLQGRPPFRGLNQRGVCYLGSGLEGFHCIGISHCSSEKSFFLITCMVIHS